MFGLRLKQFVLLIGCSALLATAPVRAEVLTFNIHWEGFGAVVPYADAVVTLDTAVIGITGVSLPSPLVTAINLSIHNTDTADGNYTLSDFTHLVFDVPAGLDFSRQLCGQATVADRTMCDSRGPSGFYMMTGPTLPFGSVGPTSLVFQNPDNRMYIRSFISTTAVPEPNSAAMLLAGLGLLGWMVKRRR